MLNKRQLISLVASFIIINLSACSNTNYNKPIKTKAVIKHRVKAAPLKSVDEVYANLLKEIDKQALAQQKEIASKKKIRLQQKSRVNVTTKHKPRVAQKRKQIYKAPSYYSRKPVNNIRYASLSGDYANNKQTKSFVHMMSTKHGFDRGYLNYLLSNTEATPFLKKMAYKDAFGSRKSKVKRKPRKGRWNRYRGNFLTNKTIDKGIQFWRENRVALKRAEQMYGVPQEYILGIIGVETRYGGNVGKNRAIDALAAMGFNNPRRGKYFRSELEAYLLMTRKEGLDPLKPMASYAGALGLSQFMPSNIKRYAVDHDRSGSVNLWTPHDAIGSVANYFQKHGWKTGGTVAVRAKSSNRKYRTLKTGFKSSHTLTRLKSRGVSAKHLGNISGKVSLINLNTYKGDELWIGGHNFYVITRYNHSSHYAMAVHQLAQEIKKRIPSTGQIRQAASDIEMLESLKVAGL